MSRVCSPGKCNAIIPEEDNYKQCTKCRAKDKERKRIQREKKQKAADSSVVMQSRDLPVLIRQPETIHEGDESDSDHSDESTVRRYANAEEMFTSLRKQSRQSEIDFHGEYTLPADPMVTNKERVQFTMREAWRITGFRFTVHAHRKLQHGHKLKAWCSQDKAHKKACKPSTEENVKHRDHVGMRRFDCRSRLLASCKDLKKGSLTVKLVSLRIQHHEKHVPYYDVSMPEGASQIIRESVEWCTPSSLVAKIQASYPNVTSAQIYHAWAVMSEELWKKDPKQVESAQKVLDEHRDVVDFFQVTTEPGVEQICWGLKLIAQRLTVKNVIVEIAIDATFNTNAMHLELYCVMAEFDNAGFPLSYCLLSTTKATARQKRIEALERWAVHLRDAYHIKPDFINVDKDLGEIGMVERVWPDGRIQICGWHMNKAVKERISKAKLSTTPYKSFEAHQLFPFIDISFVPPGCADPGEQEGGREGGGRDTILDEPDEKAGKPDPNMLFIHLPSKQKPIREMSPRPQLTHPPLTIKIPAPKPAQVETGESSSQPAQVMETTKRIFCPAELRELVITRVQEHRNAHPLLPGKCHPSPEGIYSWAVNKMYHFCEGYDLRELWAYLWENWYRPARWKLWAWSAAPEIPRLNTTMIMESHWSRIKKGFLRHFSKPRLDLLAWILIAKLAPSYYRKLDVLLGDIGRYRMLCAWRNSFKKAWRRCEEKHIPEPTGTFEYRTNVRRWVCTCPALAGSRFLICKHLVQGVKSVPPEFFLEVTRNRTAPIWSHPSLVPLENGPDTEIPEASIEDTEIPVEMNFGSEDGNNTDDEEDYLLEAEQRLMNDATYQERMTHIIQSMRDFADGLEYQLPFRDERFLSRLESQGKGFLNFMSTCLEKERRENSSRTQNPGTWDPHFSSAMFYRSRHSET
ncbi:hypothetical protein E1B28_003417 [Marasmius oreades]|uniref:SWIM-type domain-containing protein n=1 Tax=Marasmius oreades TaxID=181124 RepID=A0A9P7RMI4_9AGAR|nr:uncharacterized protein E1B28_003417 [Marasmius oreades]KAG7085883.1 hypothetical protein E1B28_003417 [Marasmius oreades]